jgi:CelD/BcsL family acetyltransferase involved in cellulose biosynthesis
MTTLHGAALGAETLRHPGELLDIADDWNRLARIGGSPFLTVEWLTAWWSAFAQGAFTCLLLRDSSGSLRAGACCRRLAGGRLRAAANVHSGDWDVVATDDDARELGWQALAALGAGLLDLPAIRRPASLDQARRALHAASYSVATVPGAPSPYLALPASWEELLESVSRNLRSQLGRRRRALERAGRLRFRTTSGGEALEHDLEAFLRLESSGWKADSGTAILSDPRTARLYRGFATAVAAAGWLRLHLLELDGVPIAGDLDCAFGGGTFLIKTGFDERYAEFSPGLVLRGAVLRAAIEEGSGFYDFLGGPDSYKLRWTTIVRRRSTVKGYRGPGRPLVAYQTAIRPPLRAGVRRARAFRADLARRP